MNGYKTYYYAWHDKMDKALTFQPESVKITISDEKGKSYTLKEGEFTVKTNPGGGDTFQVVVQDMKSIVISNSRTLTRNRKIPMDRR